MYKLSIITINRNNAAGLRKTIESVVSQTYTDFEYIIIDGASTDDSVNIIKEYAETTLPCGEGLGERLYWVSEPDKGIYNAMNKGILKAKGEYLLFLNSGDWLVDKMVIGDFLGLESKVDIISGNLFLWSEDKDSILIKAVDEKEISYGFFIENIIWHQSTFIKRDLFNTIGLYSEFYKIVSDWEFFIKALIIHQCSYIRFDRNITFFAKDGISGQDKWMKIHLAEREKVFKSFERLHRTYNIYSTRVDLIEKQLNEFIYLKNGNFGFLIRFILWIKEKHKISRWR